MICYGQFFFFALVFFPLLVNWTGYLDTVTLSSVVRESGDSPF